MRQQALSERAEPDPARRAGIKAFLRISTPQHFAILSENHSTDKRTKLFLVDMKYKAVRRSEPPEACRVRSESQTVPWPLLVVIDQSHSHHVTHFS